MCKYCEELKSLYWNDKNDYIREVYIELDGTMAVSHPNFGTDEYQGVNFEINYCPMCGKSLIQK